MANALLWYTKGFQVYDACLILANSDPRGCSVMNTAKRHRETMQCADMICTYVYIHLSMHIKALFEMYSDILRHGFELYSEAGDKICSMNGEILVGRLTGAQLPGHDYTGP
jgi:hypothetical protein